MILTIALNATVNVSYEAEGIAWGASNHISRMTCPGGRREPGGRPGAGRPG